MRPVWWRAIGFACAWDDDGRVRCCFESGFFSREKKTQKRKYIQTHHGEFYDACEFDVKMRTRRKKIEKPIYLHRSMQPLHEVDFTQGQSDLFENECEGYCGL